RPYRLAVDVERDDLPGAVPRVDALAVGDRARAGQVVLVVDGGQLALRRRFVVPQPLSGCSIERFDDECHAGAAGATRQRALARRGGIDALRQRWMIAALA